MTTASEPSEPSAPQHAAAEPATTVVQAHVVAPPPATTVQEIAPAPATPQPQTPAPAPAPAPAAATSPAPEPEQPQWVHPDGWPYDWLDYRGDRLAVRIPNKSAIHAISNLSFSTPAFQQKLFHRFLDKHVSPESYSRVCDRMVDPDDTGYADISPDTDPLGEILRDLLKAGGERLAAAAKALAETTS